jgi:hypothetical protein
LGSTETRATSSSRTAMLDSPPNGSGLDSSSFVHLLAALSWHAAEQTRASKQTSQGSCDVMTDARRVLSLSTQIDPYESSLDTVRFSHQHPISFCFASCDIHPYLSATEWSTWHRIHNHRRKMAFTSPCRNKPRRGATAMRRNAISLMVSCVKQA